MTTFQLCQRVARRAKNGDITTFALTEVMDVLQSVNGAIQRWYNAAPTYFKQLTEGFQLPAPRTLPTITVTQYSNVLSSDVFDPSEIGRSVVISGDGAWNQVIATDRLLNPYQGATGTASAVVYGDAVYSERYPFDRIIGDPQFANQSSAPIVLAQMRRVNVANQWWPYQYTAGIPQCWWVQYLGNSQGNEPLLVLRFAPAPATAYAINVQMAYWAKRLTMTDFKNATVMPVPDQFIEMCLIPMAQRELMTSPIWTPRSDDQRVIDRADQAEFTAKNQPGQPASPWNWVGTPVGY